MNYYIIGFVAICAMISCQGCAPVIDPQTGEQKCVEYSPISFYDAMFLQAKGVKTCGKEPLDLNFDNLSKNSK